MGENKKQKIIRKINNFPQSSRGFSITSLLKTVLIVKVIKFKDEDHCLTCNPQRRLL